MKKLMNLVTPMACVAILQGCASSPLPEWKPAATPPPIFAPSAPAPPITPLPSQGPEPAPASAHAPAPASMPPPAMASAPASTPAPASSAPQPTGTRPTSSSSVPFDVLDRFWSKQLPRKTKLIDVRYATSRKPVFNGRVHTGYGSQRLIASYPETGVVTVSVPVTVHRTGFTERPWLTFMESEEDHFVLKKTVKQQKDDFYHQIRSQLSATQNNAAFIYVHGYNVSFDDAAIRTAQIAYDLGGVALPVFFSWPSTGKTLPYTVDENNSEWTATQLRTFLADFATRTEAKRIVILAHSMGSRAVSRALSELIKSDMQTAKKFTSVILAAPDMDSQIFEDQIAPHFKAAQLPVTIYSSNNDKALVASRFAHEHPRIGYGLPDVFVHPPFETVDATGVDTDWLSHSYYGSSPVLLKDISEIISSNKTATERSLKSNWKNGRKWWVLP